jgi:predicted PurR-regulated permease PerM
VALADLSSTPHGPAQVEPPSAPSNSALTGLAVGVVIVFALYFGKDVLLPVTLAVLLSFVLSPLVTLLRRIRIPGVVAVVFSVTLAIAIIVGVGALVTTQFVEIAGDLPRYQSTIEEKVGGLRNATVGRISELTSRLQTALRQTQPQTPESSSSAKTGRPTAAEPAPVPVEVRQPPLDPLALASRILMPVLHPLATLAIVFVVAVFILIQRDDLRDRIIRLFGTRDLHRTTLAMDDAARRLSRYFLVQLGINACFGLVVAIGLYFIGLPSPLLWGTIAALMRFVPYIGSYIAAAAPILLAAAVEPGWSKALWVGALFLVTEPVMGQLVEPMLYGRSTGLSPISVVISAIFWGWLWGPVGLIISTPLMLCFVVLGRHGERLEFLNVLFGDRPALTKIENFYQRALAGDVDEVQDHAEELLKELSLTSYYDEVAIPGLELAARDLARGVLTRSQMERVRDTVMALIKELEDHEDESSKAAIGAERSADEPAAARDTVKEPPSAGQRLEAVKLPPAGEGKARVRCIAARTPLDEAPAAMLAQLLRKQGLDAEVVVQDSVSRTGIDRFEQDSVAIICVCYIASSGSTSAMRFLVRRLRQRLRDALLLIAVWPKDHPLLSDERLKQNLGEAEYVSSLHGTLKYCLAAIAGLSDGRATLQARETEVAQRQRERSHVSGSR